MTVFPKSEIWIVCLYRKTEILNEIGLFVQEPRPDN